MINCYVFFADPLMVGKVSSLAQRVESSLKTIKVIDIAQLSKITASKDIMITDYESYQKLDLNDIDESIFGKTLIIDDVETEEDGNVTYINKNYLLTTITEVISNYILENFKEKNYIPILLSTVTKSTSYPCHLYQKNGHNEFVVFHPQNTLVTEALIQKLKTTSFDFLYIEEDSHHEFLSIVSKRTINKDDDESENEINAVESLHQYIIDLGFDKKIIDLTKSLHENLEKKYSHKYMVKLFDRFRYMEGSFLYNHSYLTSVIALTVGKELSWMNFENREKIYLGCILHDLGHKFKENALRESLPKSELMKLSPEEQEDILQHPTRFSRHLAQIDNIHPDIIKIVECHHGIFEDESYPKQIYPSEINLVFALFALSHEFAQALYKVNFEQDQIAASLDQLYEKFDKGNYKKLISIFKTSMENIFLKMVA